MKVRQVQFNASIWAMAACFTMMVSMMSGEALAQGAPETEKVQGPDECAECHKKETENWKDTHHYKTFSDLPRNEDAKKISDAMGLKRIKSESVCLSCHFTSQVRKGKPKPIAGISCESCHNAGADWMKRTWRVQRQEEGNRE